jgi:hypothetical protein
MLLAFLAVMKGDEDKSFEEILSKADTIEKDLVDTIQQSHEKIENIVDQVVEQLGSKIENSSEQTANCFSTEIRSSQEQILSALRYGFDSRDQRSISPDQSRHGLSWREIIPMSHCHSPSVFLVEHPKNTDSVMYCGRNVQ